VQKKTNRQERRKCADQEELTSQPRSDEILKEYVKKRWIFYGRLNLFV
jgi:hypothetical protein